MLVLDCAYPMPPLLELAARHPQLALCVAKGIPLRPNVRPLSIELQNSQLGQPQPVAFSEVISQYSVFTGIAVTVDPTNDAPGNTLKYVNDAAQAMVTGVTATMLVNGRTGHYSPVPEETPVQAFPSAFQSSAWVWRMVNPENLKAKFTVQSNLNGSPFTMWVVFTFHVPASDGDIFLAYSNDQAITELVKTPAYKMLQGQPF